MKKINFLFLILCLNIQAIAQEETGARVFSSTINEVYFMKYEDGSKVKAEITDISKAENAFPEQLLQSILSSTSYDWDIYNTLGGKDKAKPKSDKHYNNIKTINKDKNYFELKHKLEFEIEGVPTAIVKYYIIMEGKSEYISAVTVMQKYNGRWYKTTTKMVSDLAMIVWRLKSNEFEKLILAKSDDSVLKEVNSKVFVNGKLDFGMLSKEMESWYAQDTPANKAKIDYFKDPKTLF